LLLLARPDGLWIALLKLVHPIVGLQLLHQLLVVFKRYLHISFFCWIGFDLLK
jgi:hypothetical protein